MNRQAKGQNPQGRSCRVLDRVARRAAGRLLGEWARGTGRGARGLRAEVETLEHRQLLAATPIISEFVASNDTGLKDEDNQFSDWIEIHNPGTSDVNLEGYALSDDPLLPNKWAFPNVVLPAGGYLVVFGTDTNPATTSMLHTNFELDSKGEYLALRDSAGTVLTEFNPYPEQLLDKSYGRNVPRNRMTLVGPAAASRTLIPNNGALGLDWTGRLFDDNTWINGTTGIGFENEPPPPLARDFTVRQIDLDGANPIDNIAEAASIFDDAKVRATYNVISDTSIQSPVVNFGGGGNFDSDRALPNMQTDSASEGREHYIMRATARVTIPAGQWTIAINSDEGFRLKMPGMTFVHRINQQQAGTVVGDTIMYSGSRTSGTTLGTMTIPAGGITTDIVLDYYEKTGSDRLELAIASGWNVTYNPNNFVLLSDGQRGWGVENNSGVATNSYLTYTGTNVQEQMFGQNSSAYIRIPFGVDDHDIFDEMTLRMRYDDGFVAYLNGTRIASRNDPSVLDFNSAATQQHADGQALVYEDFSIPANLLVSGQNVLAIHGLNSDASDTDFLIAPELIGTDVLDPMDRYFVTPTPGADNGGATIVGIVADTQFSRDRGFYDAPIEVAITTATEGAEIHYTIDGTPPTISSPLYTGPLTINKTTTLRAAAFKTGFVSSDVDTQTYLFLEDVIRQSPTTAPGPGWPAPGSAGQKIDYGMDPDVVNNPLYANRIKSDLLSIPSFSIVMDVKDLFNPSTGIYVNPRQDGRAWERPMSIELLDPEGGNDEFQTNAGIRIRGGYSRDPSNPKHAFRVFFRDEYGDGTLDYPVFGGDAAQKFEGFDLRTFQNYSWSFEGNPNGFFMRDMLNRDMQAAMDKPSERGDYYHLYINGQYWGLFNTAERPEADYGAEYFGGVDDDYDVIKVSPEDGYNIYATDGNTLAYQDLWNQAVAGFSTNAAYLKAQGLNPDGSRNPAFPVLLDVENLIDYMLIIYWGGNLDAPISNFLSNQSPNNFFAMRNRNGDEGFKYFVHDAEHTFLSTTENRTGPFPAGNTFQKFNPQWLFQQLTANSEFRLRVADRVQKHFFNGGVLSVDGVLKLFEKRFNEIESAVVGESARWGDSHTSRTNAPITRADWINTTNNIRNGYIPVRSGNVFTQLVNQGWYPFTQSGTVKTPRPAPAFNQHGGGVPAGFKVTISGTGGTIYYTTDGSDPRLFEGAVNPTAAAYTAGIPVDEEVTVKARTRYTDGTWSALTEATFAYDKSKLRITEIMYAPAPAPEGSTVYDPEEFEYIEFQNTSNEPMALGDLAFTDGLTFDFPEITLAAGERGVIVRNLEAFQSRYGMSVNVIGVYTGRLSNEGDHLQIEGPAGQVIHDFDYNDTWFPDQTNGQGYSIVINNASLAPDAWDRKSSWRVSNELGGNPGAIDAGIAPDSVLVNEVLASASDPGDNFIEIRNASSDPVNISGWFLTNDPLIPKKWEIPAGTTIAAGEFIVFTQRDHFGGSFTLSSTSNDIAIHSASAGVVGGYRHKVDFGASIGGESFGRHLKGDGGNDFTRLVAPTPGAANSAPFVGDVIINEIQYLPSNGTEFIELRNITGSSISLDGWQLTDGVSFTFPAGTSIPAFGYMVISGNTDLATFTTRYRVPPGIPILIGWTGDLADIGENLLLKRPSVPGGAANIVVDRVNFGIESPWPTVTAGRSIAREGPNLYGNDSTNWSADFGLGSPGRRNLDTDAPTVQVVDLNPATRGRGVSTMTVTFSEPVLNYDWRDMSLRRNGTLVPLSSANNPTSVDNITWTVPNLEGLTFLEGAYSLTVNFVGTLISDYGSRLMNSSDVSNFTVNETALPDTAGNDTYHVKFDATNLLIYQNIDPSGPTPTYTLPLTSVSALGTYGGQGDNVANIDLANAPANLKFTAGGNAQVNFANGQTLGVLNLTDNARLNLPVGKKALRVGSFSMAPGALMDLADNALIIDNGNAEAIRPLLVAGRGGAGGVSNGKWNGSSGITSSTVAAADVTSEVRVLGYAINGELLVKYQTFAGVSVDDNDLLIRYTKNGDANLDGVVNNNDITILAGNYRPGTPGKHWHQADFNFDGEVNNNDITILAGNYRPDEPPVTAAAASAESSAPGAPVSGAAGGDDDEVVAKSAPQPAATFGTNEVLADDEQEVFA